MRKFVLRSGVTLFAFIESLCWAQQHHRPTLKETLEWMHLEFPDSLSMDDIRGVHIGEIMTHVITRELNYIDGKGGNPPSCNITIVYHMHDDNSGDNSDLVTIIDLSLIDPNSIENGPCCGDQAYKVLEMKSTNDKKIIATENYNKDGKGSGKWYRSYYSIEFFDREYAERFAKAFKNAVTLCGGKPSTF